jgi:ABC-type methionine transport system permease subunit
MLNADDRLAIISGAIIGSIFYMIGYPMLPITFAEPLSYTFHSINDISVNFVRTLPFVFIFTAIPAVAMGIIGSIISVKKIRVPNRRNVTSSIYLKREIMNCNNNNNKNNSSR